MFPIVSFTFLLFYYAYFGIFGTSLIYFTDFYSLLGSDFKLYLFLILFFYLVSFYPTYP